MASRPVYRVPFRRRREGMTDYHLRKRMILSSLPRLVVRGSLKNICVQLLVAKPDGDRVVASAHSDELPKRFGWKAPCGNLPAAYLTGLLAGIRSRSAGLSGAILDLGLHTPSKSCRAFTALKGVLDSGLKVPCESDILPKDSRVRGEHIATYAKQLLSTDPKLYEVAFSHYLANSLRPEALGEHFDDVKSKITEAFERG